MIQALQVIDILACWVLMGLAGVSLLTNGVYTWRQLCGSLGLLIVFIGCFVGAVVIWETGHRTPWATSQRVGCAMVGIWVYDLRFGIRRQLREVLVWIQSLPKRIREFPSRWQT